MKSVVITGSTSGIGYGLADSFLSLGCSVTISSRSNKNIDIAASKLANKHVDNKVFGFSCDVTDCSQVQILRDEAKEHFGRIDIWINNAGVAHPETEIYNYTVLDSGLPNNDPLLDLIPGTKLRLFQFEPPLQKLLHIALLDYLIILPLTDIASNGRRKVRFATAGVALRIAVCRRAWHTGHLLLKHNYL